MLAGLALHGCATARPRGEEAAPLRLVIRSDAVAPKSRTLLDELGGVEDPRALLTREAARSVARKGHQVDPRAAQQLVITLHRFDDSNLDALGTAEITLTAELFNEKDERIWLGTHDGTTTISLYRARNDPRAHLREALWRALAALP